MKKTCSFIGHRKIEITEELKTRLHSLLERLIKENGVETFLFGSRSQFDDLCHRIVTELQKNHPQIKRIMYRCRSEYAVIKEEKEEVERIAREVTKREIIYKDYDGAMMSDRLWTAGKASYVERNQDMIDASDYCVFYYDPQYLPPKRKHSKRDISEYQPKSGTGVAYEYACQRKRGGKDLAVINLCLQEEE